MRVPTHQPTTRSLRPIAAGSLALALGLAACGSSPTPTGAPDGAGPTATASPTAATPLVSASAAPVPSLAALTLLWQQGGPATASSTTVATAVDPLTGDLWAAVPFENRYWIFSPDGKYLESWGQAGTGPGQLALTDHHQHPDGWGAIAFSNDGSFYIGDTGNSRVEAFDAHRTFVRAWGTFGSDDGQFAQIISIATDGKTVWVGDGDRGDIQAFDTTGTFLRSFGSDGGFAPLALGPGTGTVYALGSPGLVVFAADGTPGTPVDLEFTGGFPVWISSDAAGNAWITVEIGHEPYTALGTWEIDASGHVVRGFAEGADVVTVTPNADAIYMSRGVQLDNTGWSFVRKYALPKP